MKQVLLLHCERRVLIRTLWLPVSVALFHSTQQCRKRQKGVIKQLQLYLISPQYLMAKTGVRVWQTIQVQVCIRNLHVYQTSSCKLRLEASFLQ